MTKSFLSASICVHLWLIASGAILIAKPGPWSAPAEVRHEENLCLAYRARLDGDILIIEAKIEPGWHTFSMDNKKRAEEKLAGKKSLGIDHPTEFTLSGGLELAGPWQQTPPKDFSKAELRWYSWGFEKQAVFAAKVKRTGSAPARIGVRGQTCTDVTCNNIDVSLTLPVTAAAGPAETDLKSLIPVR
jgi:hypothetical protein